jgi:hypothetical protein
MVHCSGFEGLGLMLKYFRMVQGLGFEGLGFEGSAFPHGSWLRV